MIGDKSITPVSGTNNPDSVTEFAEKAYNSVNSTSNGCTNGSKQHPHSAWLSARILACNNNPCAVRLIRRIPEKLVNAKSEDILTAGISISNSRLYPTVSWMMKPTLMRNRSRVLFTGKISTDQKLHCSRFPQVEPYTLVKSWPFFEF